MTALVLTGWLIVATQCLAYDALEIHVRGSHFVDALGREVRLHGVNVSGLEFAAVQGLSASNPWADQTGDPTPNWSAINAWGANVVRLPLNEASWLGYTCMDPQGKSRNPDPGGNYQATVQKSVADAGAAGLYVILDLHWSAPSHYCPLAQNPMADADNSIAFWTSVASMFKAQAHVILELFNEPFSFLPPESEAAWLSLRNGGTFDHYLTGPTDTKRAAYAWRSVGMQQLLKTVREAGAKNIVLVGALSYCQELDHWLDFMPSDPLNQMAAVWHPYPSSTVVGSLRARIPANGMREFKYAQQILEHGIPVVITETGDHNGADSVGAPYLSILLPWADAHGLSYLGWTWDVWKGDDDVLIKDRNGTPTAGYGEYFHDHLLCVAGRASHC